MKLMIIRHAIAVPHGTRGVAEDERPLTPLGRRKFERAAKGLARVARPPDALLSSPLPRAWQTAEIAAAAWGGPAPRKTPALADGDLRALAAVLARCPREGSVALVGHEPHVSALLARLLGTAKAERLEFRKGGAALVDLSGALEDGGRLVWYLPPRVLRTLAR
jgi:phosphohistidine phosphatase